MRSWGEEEACFFISCIEKNSRDSEVFSWFWSGLHFPGSLSQVCPSLCMNFISWLAPLIVVTKDMQVHTCGHATETLSSHSVLWNSTGSGWSASYYWPTPGSGHITEAAGPQQHSSELDSPAGLPHDSQDQKLAEDGRCNKTINLGNN